MQVEEHEMEVGCDAVYVGALSPPGLAPGAAGDRSGSRRSCA